MYTRGANGAAVCSSLGCGSTHSRPSRRRNSVEPYPHLLRVRRSRGTPASRSPSNHHPTAPVARSRLHANRDPPCCMLITRHLVAQGNVVGHGHRSPCRPKPIVQTRNTRTAPTCSSTSSSTALTGRASHARSQAVANTSRHGTCSPSTMWRTRALTSRASSAIGPLQTRLSLGAQKQVQLLVTQAGSPNLNRDKRAYSLNRAFEPQ
jgi:hypothetical protein